MVAGMALSRCPPEISLMIAAPSSTACRATSARQVSTEIIASGNCFPIAVRAGSRRAVSYAAELSPASGREEYAPRSSITDRKSDVQGQSEYVREDLGGG